jgi:hypothetical protein
MIADEFFKVGEEVHRFGSLMEVIPSAEYQSCRWHRLISGNTSSPLGGQRFLVGSTHPVPSRISLYLEDRARLA